MPALLLKTFLNMHIEALSSLFFVLGSIMAYALLCGLLPATYFQTSQQKAKNCQSKAAVASI